MNALNYKVQRSNRKTIVISVLSDNTVLVRCPHYLTREAIERIINKKHDWLVKIIKNNEVTNIANESILSFKQIYVKGYVVPLNFCSVNQVQNDAVFVKSILDIKKLYVQQFSDYLINYAKNISAQIGIAATSFSVKSYKSRWGCCDRCGKITLNCMVAMLLPQLQCYIVIHELCHIKHFNHSHEFWKCVEKFLPDYKLYKKKLRDFGYLLKLYI